MQLDQLGHLQHQVVEPKPKTEVFQAESEEAMFSCAMWLCVHVFLYCANMCSLFELSSVKQPHLTCMPQSSLVSLNVV